MRKWLCALCAILWATMGFGDSFPTNSSTATIQLDILRGDDEFKDYRFVWNGWEDQFVTFTLKTDADTYLDCDGWYATWKMKKLHPITQAWSNYLIQGTSDITVSNSNITFTVSHTNIPPDGVYKSQLLLMLSSNSNVVRNAGRGTVRVTQSLWDDDDGTWVATTDVDWQTNGNDVTSVSIINFRTNIFCRLEGTTMSIDVPESELDHGGLAGLTDDDHDHYVLTNETGTVNWSAMTATWPTGTQNLAVTNSTHLGGTAASSWALDSEVTTATSTLHTTISAEIDSDIVTATTTVWTATLAADTTVDGNNLDLDGTDTMSGDLNMGGNNITNCVAVKHTDTEYIAVNQGQIYYGGQAIFSAVEGALRESGGTVTVDFENRRLSNGTWEVHGGLEAQTNLTVKGQLIATNGYTAIQIHPDGKIVWGSDVTLYRSAANNLKTDDSFEVGGNNMGFTSGYGLTGAGSTLSLGGANPSIWLIDTTSGDDDFRAKVDADLMNLQQKVGDSTWTTFGQIGTNAIIWTNLCETANAKIWQLFDMDGNSLASYDAEGDGIMHSLTLSGGDVDFGTHDGTNVDWIVIRQFFPGGGLTNVEFVYSQAGKIIGAADHGIFNDQTGTEVLDWADRELKGGAWTINAKHPTATNHPVTKLYAENWANQTNIEYHHTFLIQDLTNGIWYGLAHPWGRSCTISEIYIRSYVCSVTGTVDFSLHDRTSDPPGATVTNNAVLNATGSSNTIFAASAWTNNAWLALRFDGLSDFSSTNRVILDIESTCP